MWVISPHIIMAITSAKYVAIKSATLTITSVKIIIKKQHHMA